MSTNTITKKMTPAQIQALYQRTKPFALRETKPNYTFWQLKTSEMTITAYTSGKVVYQGTDLSWLIEEDEQIKLPADSKTAKAQSSLYPQAGSDEVGTGDYFGPVVVAAAIVESQEIAAILQAMNVTDSKAMTDEAIMRIGEQLKSIVPHSIIILDNERYNRIYDPQSMNLNKIKARMHNQVYLNLIAKGYSLPDLCVVDQFCKPETYFRYLKGQPEIYDHLTFQTKAESSFAAVAAASVLARYTFLKAWEQLEQQAGFPLHKGGGAQADQSAKKLAEKLGKEKLSHFVKLHFANTSRL